ncbi:MAG: 23S rRNA (adenine(2503)-C(2))-methyltransferase RlmN [Calditrichaeota bacterium]|nr:23S rRNA (adenine(2503)-C(2))-methyltransferase RlmN [Calditrichota bacterium]
MQFLCLKGLSVAELEEYVKSIGEPRYRARQIFTWMYGRNVDTFEAMTNLSKDLRLRLTEGVSLSALELLTSQKSVKDQSEKFVFKLQDGLAIESVLMFEDNRATICVSTQVGCAIDCKFCATGMMGLKRNLSDGEIIDQFLTVQRLKGRKITNVVMMGMGEPFHNYDNLMKACALLTDGDGPNLANKHIVVSTSGLIPRIYQFADEKRKYRLAISLNATTDEVRTRLMPLNKRWPIRELLKAAKYYTEKLGEPVTFEYVLLQGVNDTLADADRLKKMLDRILCKVNLIPYNPTVAAYQRTSEKRILAFYERLSDMRAPVMIRWSKGDDIDAGCGQLATNV